MLVRSLSVALLALWICGPGGQSAHAADIDTQRDLVNGGVVGLVSDGVIADVDRQEGLHLLAIPPARIKAAYVPSELTAEAYPRLIDPGQPVQTIAVSAVLAAYNWPADHPRRAKLTRFIDRFYANFDRLLEPPFHPKWKEVDLKAEVAGWQRIAPAGKVAVAAE